MAVAAGAGLGAAGCTMPVAAWPEWPAGFGHVVRVEDPRGWPAGQGCVLLRVYEYNGAGLAEGDRNVRNEQVLDAAFDYRRAVRVNVKPDTMVRHRLVDVQTIPIRPGGNVELPAVVEAGSLWLVTDTPKARPGAHPRVHFAEVQALVPDCPPSARAEVSPDLCLVRVRSGENPVEWRQELEHARADLLQVRPYALSARTLIEAELEHLRQVHPEAFVPDGVSLPPAEAAEKP